MKTEFDDIREYASIKCVAGTHTRKELVEGSRADKRPDLEFPSDRLDLRAPPRPRRACIFPLTQRASLLLMFSCSVTEGA